MKRGLNWKTTLIIFELWKSFFIRFPIIFQIHSNIFKKNHNSRRRIDFAYDSRHIFNIWSNSKNSPLWLHTHAHTHTLDHTDCAVADNRCMQKLNAQFWANGHVSRLILCRAPNKWKNSSDFLNVAIKHSVGSKNRH